MVTKTLRDLTNGITPKFSVDKVSYNSVTLRIKEKTNQIPFFLYKGIPYEVKLNEKNVKIDTGGILNIKAKRGDMIQISSEATWWNYMTFIISTVTILVVGIGIVFFEVRKKNKVSYKKRD